MNSQSPWSTNRDSSESLPWESWEKVPFRYRCHGQTQKNYMGEGGGFPRVRAEMSQMNPGLPVVCPSIKNAPECELTNLLVGLMQVLVTK
jgi:hypothetical protein